MKEKIRLGLCLFFGLLISSCGFLTPAATPTPIPISTATHPPTNTPTSLPTSTPTPKPTFAPTQALPSTEAAPLDIASLLDAENIPEFQEYRVVQGGYNLRLSIIPWLEVKGNTAYIEFDDMNLRIFLSGASGATILLSPDSILTGLLASSFDQPLALTEETKQAILVDGIEGVSIQVEGQRDGRQASTFYVVVEPVPSQVFILFALIEGEQPGYIWTEEQTKAILDIVDGVSFIPQEELVSAEICPLAVDESYGYIQENPIKIGGGLLLGQMRQRAYLLNLLGPAGEPLESVKDLVWLPTATTILEEVNVTIAGKNYTLYFDSYHYEPLLTPVGLNCLGAYPLKEPPVE